MIFVIVPLLLASAGVIMMRKYRGADHNPLAFLKDHRALLVGVGIAAISVAISLGNVTVTPLNVTSIVVSSVIWFLIAAAITHFARPTKTPAG